MTEEAICSMRALDNVALNTLVSTLGLGYLYEQTAYDSLLIYYDALPLE
ncbi:MAG: hypothetical protein Q4A64_04800 [Porphyromonadaceae bacterium]|nr:hypothetical protein [Porphyromonadaceae bacterium]